MFSTQKHEQWSALLWVYLCCTTVVHMAKLGPNQSEREKDNIGIVLEGHVSH